MSPPAQRIVSESGFTSRGRRHDGRCFQVLDQLEHAIGCELDVVLGQIDIRAAGLRLP